MTAKPQAQLTRDRKKSCGFVQTSARVWLSRLTILSSANNDLALARC